VVDTGVILSLNATGCAREILSLLHGPVILPRAVHQELGEGHHYRRLTEMMATRQAVITDLGPQGLLHFETLVIGPAATTLDDGEAATIACALEAGAIAVIDEPKAVGLCAERFPGLTTASTVDLLRQDIVLGSLGTDGVRRAVLSALKRARMRVPDRHREWAERLY
jgi:predicted nucleic acid-binding protein